MKYIISARCKPDIPMSSFVINKSIESIFGCVEFTPMYGGRHYLGPEISSDDVEWMYDNGIGLNLPLTNMYTTEEEYNSSYNFLNKYHKVNNVITVYRDDIARFIRRDFPLYSICCSAIRDVKTHDDINSKLNIYDNIVLRSWANVDDVFLNKIEQKDRIILFSSMGMQHNCHSKVCFSDISHYNSKWTPDSIFPEESELRCFRKIRGILDDAPKFQQFDIKHLQDLGFSKFKVLRQWHETRAY